MTFPIRFSGKHLGDESRPKLLILLGALGEIRTPDPRIRSPMLYPAELRARAWARLPDLARQGQHPAAGPVAAMSQHQMTPRQLNARLRRQIIGKIHFCE